MDDDVGSMDRTPRFRSTRGALPLGDCEGVGVVDVDTMSDEEEGRSAVLSRKEMPKKPKKYARQHDHKMIIGSISFENIPPVDAPYALLRR